MSESEFGKILSGQQMLMMLRWHMHITDRTRHAYTTIHA